MSNLLTQGAEPQLDSSIVFIYGLVDPITGYIRYVGKAADTTRRYKAHFAKSELSPNTKKVNWIKSLLALNLKPRMIVIEEVLQEHWEKSEIKWISFYRSIPGYPELTNGTQGGDGLQKGYKLSTETRRKIGIANKGKTISPEARGKIGAANRGRTHSQEALDKMSAAQKSIWAEYSEQEKKARGNLLKRGWLERENEVREKLREIGKKWKDCSSQYIGVNVSGKYWRAWVKVGDKRINVGKFIDELDAARTRDCVAIRLLGPSAKTNFPVSSYSKEDIEKEIPTQGKRIDNTSGYKGVYWNKSINRWTSVAWKNKKRVPIGVFPPTEDGKISAARSYDRWVIQNRDSTAYTNFPRHNYLDILSLTS